MFRACDQACAGDHWPRAPRTPRCAVIAFRSTGVAGTDRWQPGQNLVDILGPAMRLAECRLNGVRAPMVGGKGDQALLLEYLNDTGIFAPTRVNAGGKG